MPPADTHTHSQPRQDSGGARPLELSMAAIVLAAGKGTRMLSSLPKVLHPVQGIPMLAWVLNAVKHAGAKQICAVLSEDLSGFSPLLSEQPDLVVAIQKNRQGTGDAVASAAYCFQDVKIPPYAAGRLHQGNRISSDYVLICAGDTPALSGLGLRQFVEASIASQVSVSVLGMHRENPYGYGRLITDGSKLTAIIEEKDADTATRAIKVCNTGVIFARTQDLFNLLAQLTADNAQREYYLTDIVKLAHRQALTTSFHLADEGESFAGINDRAQLAEVETWMVTQNLQRLLKQGVSIQQPSSVYVDAQVQIARDTLIEPYTNIRGSSRIGSHCLIESGCRLENVIIGDHVRIGGGSVLSNCEIKTGEFVPPLSLRT